ncbi:MAG: hypothetical protein V2I79_09795 [Xanthomonadales bacterium]|jgi:hypothetical protein|nr:hypothetical protein [Xanthomonadales bacterium]
MRQSAGASGGHALPLLAVLFLAPGGLLSAAAPELPQWPVFRFEAAQIEWQGRRIEGLRLELEEDGLFVLAVERVADAEREPLIGPSVLAGRLEQVEQGADEMQASGTAEFRGLEANWRYSSARGNHSLCLDAASSAIEKLLRSEWPIEGNPWTRSGSISGCAAYPQDPDNGDAMALEIVFDGISFDSPEGRFAGADLDLEIAADVRFGDDVFVEAEGRLASGQVLIDQFYGDFSASPIDFRLLPQWTASGLESAAVKIQDDGALHVDARLAPNDGGDWAVEVRQLDLGFPGAYRRYIEPFAAAWMLDGLEMTGGVRWSGTLMQSRVESGNLDVSDLSIVDVRRDRFALTGLSTRLRPGDENSQSAVSWSGLLFERINLGAGSALLDTTPGAFALASPLRLDVLGGQLQIDRLRYVMPGSPAAAGAESRFEMQAKLAGIDMARLTRAFGWPRFDGRLSGEIPRVRLDAGVLRADGEMRFEIFDGEVTVGGLSAERLFGVLPSLAADIQIRNLDLEQVTSTFEFGTIGGRLDGRVDALRLLDWRPVSFDAWLGTPEDQGSARSISRRAVRNLTAIGGGSGAAALSSPIIRMFQSFSYRRLALGCRLENYVCHITGLDDDGESVLLLEGAGIPRITVRAWNRSVDWTRMMENLANLSSEPTVQLGGAPDS